MSQANLPENRSGAACLRVNAAPESRKGDDVLLQVLDKIRSAGSAVNLNELSRQLGVKRSALEGMITHLVQKGKLQDDDETLAAVTTVCNGSSCGGSCPGLPHCPFITKMPRTFSLNLDDL